MRPKRGRFHLCQSTFCRGHSFTVAAPLTFSVESQRVHAYVNSLSARVASVDHSHLHFFILEHVVDAITYDNIHTLQYALHDEILNSFNLQTGTWCECFGWRARFRHSDRCKTEHPQGALHTFFEQESFAEQVALSQTHTFTVSGRCITEEWSQPNTVTFFVRRVATQKNTPQRKENSIQTQTVPTCWGPVSGGRTSRVDVRDGVMRSRC